MIQRHILMNLVYDSKWQVSTGTLKRIERIQSYAVVNLKQK